MMKAETQMKNCQGYGITDGLKSRREIRNVRAGITFSEICAGKSHYRFLASSFKLMWASQISLEKSA